MIEFLVEGTPRSLQASARGKAQWQDALGSSGGVTGFVYTSMRIATPRGLLQQLASRGLISTEEEREIAKLAEARNRAAHGDWHSSGPRLEFKPLLDLAQRLLAEPGEMSAVH